MTEKSSWEEIAQESLKILKDVRKRIDQLEEIKKIQCTDGNWDYDSYMHGMANGLILALSMLKKEDPKFLDAPLKYIKSSPNIAQVLSQGITTDFKL